MSVHEKVPPRSDADEMDTEGHGSDKPNGTGDILIAVVFIVFGVLMTMGALNFRWSPRMGIITAPAFTPILLSVMVTVLSIVLIVRTLIRYGVPDVKAWCFTVICDERMRRSAVLILFTGIYIVMVGRLHFLLATTIYLFAMFWYLKLGRLWIVLLSAVVAGLFVSVFIPGVFRMPLP